MAGKLVFLIASLSVWAVFGSTDQIASDVSASQSSKDESSVLERLLLHLEPDLKKFVEDDLVFSQKQVKVESIWKTHASADCSHLRIQGEKPSVYIGTSGQATSGIHLIRCSKPGMLEGLIIIHPYLASHLNKFKASIIRPLISSLMQSNGTNFDFELEDLEMCPDKNLELATLTCDGRGRKQQLSLEEKYNILVGVGVPYAVNELAQDPLLTSEFHSQLVDNLFNYVYYDGQTSSSGTVTDYDAYEQVYYALMSLLSDYNRKNLNILEGNLNKIIAISESALLIQDPVRLLNDDTKVKILDLALLYVKHYDIKYEQNDARYIESVSKANNMINSIYSFVASGGRLNELTDINFWASSYGFRYQYKSGDYRHIGMWLRADFGSSLDCSCNFCSSSKIVLKIEIEYYNFGTYSDMKSIQLYELGEVTDTSEYFYYPSPTHLSISGSDCYELIYNLYHDDVNELRWECLSIPGITQDCQQVNINEDNEHFKVSDFGLVTIQKVCEPTFGVDQGNPYFCIKIKCLNNCECWGNSICKYCISPYKKNNEGYCSDCMNGFSKNDEGECVECPTKCSTCDAYKNCLKCENGYLLIDGICQECEFGYRKRERYNDCVCDYGFAINWKNQKCEPCSKGCECKQPGQCDYCSVAYKPDERGACSLCNDGYGLSVDGQSCEPCGTNCLCNQSGQCDKCNLNYAKDSEFSCNNCAEGYAKDTKGQCTICSSGFVRPWWSKFCQPCSENCNCFEPNRCDYCLPGFAFIYDGSYQCKPCSMVNCYCSQENTCSGCIEGFAFQDGVCKSCKDNCVCSTPGKCSNCIQGYFKDSEGNCNLCIPGYGKDEHGNCKLCRDNCECERAYTCDRCKPGYGYDYDNECRECYYQGCECSKDRYQCETCREGYGVYDPYNLDMKCRQCSERCTCKIAFTCDNCIERFRLEGNYCSKCNYNYIQDEWNAQDNNCRYCARGFGYDQIEDQYGHSCEKCGKNCGCDWSFGCDYCLDGYKMDELQSCTLCAVGYGRTESGDCKPCLKGCLCQEAGQCDDCLPSLKRDAKGFCNVCNDNLYNHEGCNSCIDGYFRNENGICESCKFGCGCYNSQDCSFCLKGFYRSSSETCESCPNGCYCNYQDSCYWCLEGYGKNYYDECVPCPANCFCSYENQCDSCRTGYERDENNECLKCSQGYAKDLSGFCKPCVFGCGCEVPDDCSYCLNSGYVVNDLNYCEPCPTGCSCTKPGVCDSCPEGYGLNEHQTCDPCPKNCKCTLSGKCDSCIGNFKMDSKGSCNVCQDEYNDSGYGGCSGCSSGYGLSQENYNLCSACKPNCICSWAGECNGCKLGFGFDGLSCESCEAGCTCSTPFTCNGCLPGYTNFKNTEGILKCAECEKNCECKYPGFCDYCSVGYQMDENGHCSLCAPGFGLNDQGDCMPCRSNCLCSVARECDACQPGFAFDRQTKLCLVCAGNCLCSVPNTCEKCTVGTFKSYFEPCQVNYCYNDRCICDLYGKCIKCTENYFNPDTVCNECAEGFERDFYYDLRCERCKSGYYMDNFGKCRKCQLGCECNISNKCLSCVYGYQSDGQGGCARCNEFSFPDSQGKCTLCVEGYFLSNENCIRCNDNCACKDYQCQYCLEGYGRDGNGYCNDCKSNCICSQAYTCLACKEGYVYDSSVDYCVECQMNCLCSIPGGCDFCKNGYQMNTDGQCLECISGFGLQGNQCKPCRTGCSCQEAYTCSGCLEGYTYDITTNTCKLCKEGCICSSENICESCVKGFYFDGVESRCSKCKVNCECMEPGQCLSCLENSVMDGNGECTICVEGYISNESPCDSCAPGYGRNSAGQCVKCKEGCTCTYEGSCNFCLPGYGISLFGGCRACKNNCNCLVENTCDTCFQGFYKHFNGECLPCPGNCECDQSGKCLKCAPGYIHPAEFCLRCDVGYVSDEYGKCMKCQPGCICSAPDECSSCIPGNLKDGEGKCSLCSPGLLMDSEGRCLECPAGKTLLDLDGMICIDCPENCETCEGIDLKCSKCKEGFGFNDQGTKCALCLPNCLCKNANMCDSCREGYLLDSTHQCITCVQGFYFNKGECLKCQENCICDENNKCIMCIDGTGFNDNKECMPCLDNCLCDKAFTCKTCLRGFAMQKDLCLPCLPNCLCYIPYTCTSCLEGNTELSINGCTVCDFRHEFDPETNSCSKCAKGYRKNGDNTCSQCDELYSYDENYYGGYNYRKCSPCKTGCKCYYTYLYNPQCHDCIYNDRSNCGKCNPGYISVHGWCDTCAEGYGLNFIGLCKPCALNCKCNHAGQCLSCLDGFARVSEDSECLPCNLNCLCDKPNTCSSCKEGYTAISDSECKKCDPGCSCDKYNSCTKCLEGYLFDSLRRKCNSCKEGYFLDNASSQCLPCIEGCLCTQDFSNQCYGCIAGYYFDNNYLCSKCSFEGCSCNNANQCTGCLPGYGRTFEDSIIRCLPCKENCFCNYFNQCTSCKPGFTMNSFGICQSCEQGFSENLDYAGFNHDCTICRSGHIWDPSTGNNCVKCSENCECSDFKSDVGCDRCKAGSVFAGWIGEMLQCDACRPHCKCSFLGGCDACLPGFVLNEEGECWCEPGFVWSEERERCETCLEGCYCQSQGECDGCLPHHVRNALQECVLCEYPYSKGADRRCTVCLQGYAKSSDGQCMPCLNGCSCKQPDTCDECLWDEGYYMTSTFECNKCDENCLTCDNEKCKTCSAGYFQQYGNCFPCPLGCSNCIMIENKVHCLECFNSYLNQDDQCIDCFEGFYQDYNGLCKPCSIGCNCDDQQSCLNCREGYSSDEAGGCTSCSDGYGKDQNGNCIKCDEFCKCSHGSTCNSCEPNHSFSFGNCFECEAGYTKDESGSCSKCIEGFIQDSEGKCKDCLPGYVLTDNLICQQCRKNCKCSQPHQCDSCIEGYEYLFQYIDYLGYDDYGCITCSIGYSMNTQGQCEPCSLNCECYSPGTCYNCLAGFKREIDGSCLECKDGYAKDSKGVCRRCYDNCLCSTPDTCDMCTEGYLFSGYQCIDCSEGYGRSGNNYNLCLPCVANCLCQYENQCDSCKVGYTGYNCGVCDSGYAPNGRFCEPCLENCFCEKPGQCSSCMHKYQKDENGACTRCAEGFGKLTEKSCDSCNENCICEQAYTCTGCLPSYVFINNNCIPGKMYFNSGYIDSFLFDEYLQTIHLSLTVQIEASLQVNDCSYYFINFDILGSGNFCQLKNAHTLVIWLGNDWSISSSNGLWTRESFLLLNVEYSLFESHLITPSFPEGLDINPHAVITGPREITVGCSTENLYLFSASSSFGVNSKRFSYTWEVSSEVSLSYLSPDIVQVSLNSDSIESFSIVLTVNNVIGSPSTTGYAVTVKNLKIITFILDSGQYSVIKRANFFTVAPISINYCNVFGLPTYKWSISPPIAGVDLTLSKLRVPSNTFSYGSYSISLTISLGNLQGTAEASVMVEASQLLASINKGNQEISSILDLPVSGSASSDPDGFNLNFEWFLDDVLISVDPSLVISKDFFTGLKTFNLRLEVWTLEENRRGSSFIVLTVRQDLKLTVSIVGQETKAPISTMTNLKVAVVKDPSIASLSYEWTQVSGPNLYSQYLTGNYQSSLTISKGVLSQGYSYSYKVTVTARFNDGAKGQATTDKFFTANVIPSCSGGLVVSPNQGVQLKTKFTLAISGCNDGDLVDVPLTYKAYYFKSGKWAILTTSKNPVIMNLPLTTGVTSLAFDVCDTLGDCSNYPASVTVRSSRRSMAEESLNDLYNEYARDHDPIFAISLILGGFEADEQLLVLMWKDFEQYMNEEFFYPDALEVTFSTVSLFLNDLQNFELKKQHAETYLNYLETRMLETQGINSRSEITLLSIARQVFDLNEEKWKLRAFSLLTKFLELNTVEVHEDYKLSSSDIIVFESDNLIEYFKSKEIDIFNNKLSVKDLDLPSDALIKVEVIKISEFFSVKLSSSKTYSNGYFEDCDPKEIKIPKGSVKLTLLKTSLNQAECLEITENLPSGSCEITEDSQESLTVSLNSVGIFQIKSKEIEKSTSSSGKSSESSSGYFGPVMILAPLTLLSFIILPFLKLFRKQQADHVPDNTIIENQSNLSGSPMKNPTSERNMMPQTVSAIDITIEATSNLQHEGYFLKIVKSEPLGFFAYVIYANFCLAVVLQGVILNVTMLNAFIVGPAAAGLVFPVSFALVSLRSCKFTVLPWIIVSLSVVASTVAAFFIGSSEGWYWAMLTGLLTELISFQLVFYISFRLASQ